MGVFPVILKAGIFVVSGHRQGQKPNHLKVVSSQVLQINRTSRGCVWEEIFILLSLRYLLFDLISSFLSFKINSYYIGQVVIELIILIP